MMSGMPTCTRHAVLASLLAFSTLAAGCTTQSPGDAGNRETLWEDCDGAECRNIDVPSDWSAPDGERHTMRIFRAPADTQPADGAIVLHVGGPGDPYLDTFQSEDFRTDYADLLETFDIVGFDDRGVAGESLLQCDLPEDWPTLNTTDDAEESASVHTQACKDSAADALPTLDSQSVARDMDEIRKALGYDVLHVLGYSYGTQYAQEYIRLFPEHAGRVVLDSPVDVTMPLVDLFTATDRTSGQAATLFKEWCAEAVECLDLPGQGTDDFFAKAKELLSTYHNMDDEQWPSPEAWESWVNQALQSSDSWPSIAEAVFLMTDEMPEDLLTLMSSQDGEEEEEDMSAQELSADVYLPSNDPYYARICTDYTVTDDDIAAYRNQLEDQPTDFELNSVQILATCKGWPRPSQRSDAPIKPTTPPLILSATTDVATPCSIAAGLHEEFDGSAHIVIDRVGHAVFPTGDDELDDAVVTYFQDGTMPESSGECPTA